MNKTLLKLSLVIGIVTAWTPGFALDIHNFSSSKGGSTGNGPYSSLIHRVQQMSRAERCEMNCKVSYNICREGRGRNNNSVCVKELNECLPGC